MSLPAGFGVHYLHHRHGQRASVAERPVALSPESEKERAVTRHSFISPGVFGPEAIAGMSEAYEATLASQPNAVPEVIVGRIIAAARLGERDPVRLRAAALARP